MTKAQIDKILALITDNKIADSSAKPYKEILEEVRHVKEDIVIINNHYYNMGFDDGIKYMQRGQSHDKKRAVRKVGTIS